MEWGGGARAAHLAVLVAQHGLVGHAALVLLAGHSASPHLAQLAAARHGAVVVLALLRVHLQQHPHPPARSQNTECDQSLPIQCTGPCEEMQNLMSKGHLSFICRCGSLSLLTSSTL